MKTVKMEFLMDIDDESSLDAIKNLEHHAEYFLNLNAYPEIIAVHRVKVTVQKEEKYNTRDSLEMYQRYKLGRSIKDIASDYSISVSMVKGRISNIEFLLCSRSVDDLKFFLDLFDGYNTHQFTKTLGALARNNVCTKKDLLETDFINDSRNSYRLRRLSYDTRTRIIRLQKKKQEDKK